VISYNEMFIGISVVPDFMINNKLVWASFIALAMFALAATTIITQETYAVHVGGAGLGDGYCGTNWQGSFHLSLGDPSLSIPPGMCMPDRTSTLG
jgi:hypothetical protein